MPANVETMFYVREKPWHGLGVRVEDAPTSEEAIKISGLDWDVNPCPIYVNGRPVDGMQANVRSKDGSVLGIVTGKYKIVQNAEAFEFTDYLIGVDGVKYETAGSLDKGRRVWMLAQMPDIKVLGDKVEPYLVFSNFHDGKGAITVATTPIRVVCQNTLNLALNGAKRSWSCRHIGSIKEKMEEARRTLEFAHVYLDKFNEEAENLASVKIRRIDKFLDNIFPFPTEESNPSQRKINNIETLRTGFMKAYNMPDLSDFKGTGWGVVNAMSDFITHSTPLRNSKDYKENLFGNVVDGHKLIDLTYDILKAA